MYISQITLNSFNIETCLSFFLNYCIMENNGCQTTRTEAILSRHTYRDIRLRKYYAEKYNDSKYL